MSRQMADINIHQHEKGMPENKKKHIAYKKCKINVKN